MVFLSFSLLALSLRDGKKLFHEKQQKMWSAFINVFNLHGWKQYFIRCKRFCVSLADDVWNERKNNLSLWWKGTRRISHFYFWELKCYLISLVGRVNGFFYGLWSDNEVQDTFLVDKKFSLLYQKCHPFVVYARDEQSTP